MISIKELRKTAKAHLKDSEILFQNKRYNGSIYLCGYAVEIALKLRLCKTLQWTEFPEKKKEFANFTTFKTHDLDVLLQLSGKKGEIKSSNFAEVRDASHVNCGCVVGMKTHGGEYLRVIIGQFYRLFA